MATRSGMTLDASQSRLYVAQDNADQVAVIDTTSNRIVRTIDARAPAECFPEKYTGAATSAVTLSPDGGHAVCGQQRRELYRGDSAVRKNAYR